MKITYEDIYPETIVVRNKQIIIERKNEPDLKRFIFLVENEILKGKAIRITELYIIELFKTTDNFIKFIYSNLFIRCATTYDLKLGQHVIYPKEWNNAMDI